MRRGKRLTISDVAKLAGVSPATISRVISNSPGVGEKTRREILALLDEMDYHPSVSAQSLAGKRSNTLGLVIPRDATYVFSNPYYLELLRGIAEEAGKLDYRLLVSVGTGDQAYDELFKSGAIDGLILTSARYKDKRIARLIYDGYPFSLIGRFDTDMLPEGRQYIVDINHVKAARTVTEYLVSLGHTSIGYISGPMDYYLTVHRLQGYREALRDRDLEVPEEYVAVEDGFMEHNGNSGMMRLLSLPDRPTAVFVFNDLMAMGAVQAVRSQGLRVPDDVSVIGFDNIMTAPFLDPPLTTVEHSPYKKASLATKLLVDDLSGAASETRNVEIPFEIVRRQSCKPI